MSTSYDKYHANYIKFNISTSCFKVFQRKISPFCPWWRDRFFDERDFLRNKWRGETEGAEKGDPEDINFDLIDGTESLWDLWLQQLQWGCSTETHANIHVPVPAVGRIFFVVSHDFLPMVSRKGEGRVVFFLLIPADKVK